MFYNKYLCIFFNIKFFYKTHAVFRFVCVIWKKWKKMYVFRRTNDFRILLNLRKMQNIFKMLFIIVIWKTYSKCENDNIIPIWYTLRAKLQLLLLLCFIGIECVLKVYIYSVTSNMKRRWYFTLTKNISFKTVYYYII